MSKKSDDNLKSKKPGWASDYGCVYHYKHVSLAWAKEMKKCKEFVFAVDTVNWTLHDSKTVHHNTYFEHGFADALALAVRIELGSIEIAEEVIGIRLPTERELNAFYKASEDKTV